MAFSSQRPAGIGLIGAGNIARRYVRGMARFPQLQLVGVHDTLPRAAEALAGEAQVRSFASLEELLDDRAVDVAVNITPPAEHAAVTQRALAAGKHVYTEKPIADRVGDAQACADAADAAGLVLGVAPDTFLGSAARTARAAIDDGMIGEPVAASLFITHSKAEAWHPDPTFLFQPGGGPLLDLGPYYVTALVNLLGPVAEVSGFTRIGAATRAVTSPDRRVEQITVTTPTHATASLRLHSGVLVTALASFDVWDAHLPRIEVYGTSGTLTLPDPNEFDGPVQLRTHDAGDWVTLPPVGELTGTHGAPVQLLRGLGVRDLVQSLDGGPLRVSAQLGVHVLETLTAIQQSSDAGTVVPIRSTVQRPAPVTA